MSSNFKLSVSKTKTFAQCKAKYKFSYIDKLPKKDRDYHILGKFCHKVLEDFHLAKMNGSLEPIHSLMGVCFKAAKKEFKGPLLTSEMIKECFDILNKYLQMIYLQEKEGKVANVIACEKAFELALSDNFILNGMIDRVQIDPDGVIHVADYKTTKKKEYLKDDWFQLLTYAYVMLMEDPSISKIRASYILLRYDFEYLTTEFFPEQIQTIKDQYINYAKNMLGETEFPATTGPLCFFCDHVDSCEPGSQKIAEMGVRPSTTVFGEVSW